MSRSHHRHPGTKSRNAMHSSVLLYEGGGISHRTCSVLTCLPVVKSFSQTDFVFVAVSENAKYQQCADDDGWSNACWTSCCRPTGKENKWHTKQPNHGCTKCCCCGASDLGLEGGSRFWTEGRMHKCAQTRNVISILSRKSKKLYVGWLISCWDGK